METAEADDIIGTLAPIYSNNEDVLIISSDRDFLQLQKYNNINKFKIKQYNPVKKKLVISEDPVLELKTKIITGDKGDGIPNILSAPDSFVKKIRQKSLTEDRLDRYVKDEVGQYDDTAKTGFHRNQLLIDLTFIPQTVQDKIINTYNSTIPAKRNKLLNFFIEKRLKNLMEDIGDF